jgi:thymidylate synthase ThyX
MGKTHEGEDYLNYLLSLGNKFHQPPRVNLRLISQPLSGVPIGSIDIASSVATQCYSPGIALMKARPEEKPQRVAAETLDAGHHTTRMHATYTFAVVGASRLAIHDGLHDNPFQSSDQQSQRYAEIRSGNFVRFTDVSSSQQTAMEGLSDQSNQNYAELTAELRLFVMERLSDSGKIRGKSPEAVNLLAQKMCQEIARYMVVIGQFSNLFYTINELQLLRMFHATAQPDCSDEIKFIVGSMVQAVAEADAQFITELRPPSQRQRPVLKFSEELNQSQKNEFDLRLGEGDTKLIATPENGIQVLGIAVRNVLGLTEQQMPDSAAIKMLIDPSQNPLLADVYETGIMDPLTRCLRQVQITYLTRLSHAGDSQRQRHRRTPGADPVGTVLVDGTPDFFTPMIIRENPSLLEKYNFMMDRHYEGIRNGIGMGISRDQLAYLLPNAHRVRLVESGDLFDWIHRFKQRLCYLAQEEICFVSISQARQLIDEFPQFSSALLAPCGIRKSAGVKPYCPEGPRFCGQPVYHMKLEEYSKNRII